MGNSSDYKNVPDWVTKPEGYQADQVVKYKGNVFRAAFWASEPGVGDANKNGWRLFDELYDKTKAAPPSEPAKIIAYIPTWRKKEGFAYGKADMYRYITHGIISFLQFSENDLGRFDGASVNEVTQILPQVVSAGHLYGKKIMIALGGAVDYGFLNLMTAAGSNPNLPQFNDAVRNVVGFVNANSLDGVDLDLECWWGKPGDKDQGGRAKSDGPHPAGLALTRFAQKLKEAMPGKLISAATFGTSWYGNNYDPKLVDHVDWLAIMTYDFTGSWDKSPVGPHTALHTIRPRSTSSIRKADVYLESYLEEQHGTWPGGGPENNPILSIEDALWYWTNPFFTNWQGVGQRLPRKKIVAGVPIYGYDFAYAKEPDDLSGQVPPGYKSIRYKDILADFPDAHQSPNANIKIKGNTPRPALANPLPPGNYPYKHNIYFETPKTAVTKLNFLKDIGTQGVIIWELTNDVWEEGKSIIKALYKASGNSLQPPIAEANTQPINELPSRYLWDSVGFLGGSKDSLQFQDDGIVRPGVRKFAARLWNVPSGEDWKQAAYRSPAVVKRQYFNRPTRIDDKKALGLWGEFEVIEQDDVPAWYWGHLEKGDGPKGFKRYGARLWGLPTSGGDWVASSKATPALIEGQYFNEPTDYSDRGFFGFYGIFDVKETADGVPIRMPQVRGDHSCFYCMVRDLEPPGRNVNFLNLSDTMTVAPGTPFLYAVLTKSSSSTDFPNGVTMTIKDPDGNSYDRDGQDDNKIVKMAGSSVRSLIVKNPKAGEWFMSMSFPAGARFHCECNTVPSDNVVDTMISTYDKLSKSGLVPRGLKEAAPWVALATASLIFGPAIIGAWAYGITVAAVGVGIKKFNESDIEAQSQSMSGMAKILNKLNKDIDKKGYSVLLDYVWLVGKNISFEEYKVILRYPRNTFMWLGTHADVYAAVEHIWDPDDKTDPGDRQNAIRHVYWQCLLKRRLGEQFAKEMADAHERAIPGTHADNVADEYNNKKGLELADQVGSDEECLERTFEMWKNKELKSRKDVKSDPT